MSNEAKSAISDLIHTYFMPRFPRCLKPFLAKMIDFNVKDMLDELNY